MSDSFGIAAGARVRPLSFLRCVELPILMQRTDMLSMIRIFADENGEPVVLEPILKEAGYQWYRDLWIGLLLLELSKHLENKGVHPNGVSFDSLATVAKTMAKLPEKVVKSQLEHSMGDVNAYGICLEHLALELYLSYARALVLEGAELVHDNVQGDFQLIFGGFNAMLLDVRAGLIGTKDSATPVRRLPEFERFDLMRSYLRAYPVLCEELVDKSFSYEDRLMFPEFFGTFFGSNHVIDALLESTPTGQDLIGRQLEQMNVLVRGIRCGTF
ncbi:MAG TPA: hypothetical protein VHG93_01125 [Longimicrobium sp.]|nr:hypothetical protein [Longimicrobium sp.]